MRLSGFVRPSKIAAGPTSSLPRAASQFESLRPWSPPKRSTGRRSSVSTSTSTSACPCRIRRRFAAISRKGWSIACPSREFHYLDGEADPASECRRMGDLIRRHPIDVALLGIGENGHLAFNDPPADFQTAGALHCRRSR